MRERERRKINFEDIYHKRRKEKYIDVKKRKKEYIKRKARFINIFITGERETETDRQRETERETERDTEEQGENDLSYENKICKETTLTRNCKKEI